MRKVRKRNARYPLTGNRQRRKRHFGKIASEKLEPLVEHGIPLESEFAEVAKVNEIEGQIKGLISLTEACSKVIDIVGKKEAALFIKSHLKEFSQGMIHGFDDRYLASRINIRDRFSKIKSPLHPLSGKTTARLRNTPEKVFEDMIRNTKPANQKAKLGLCYIFTLYKIAEKQAGRIYKNFQKNAVILLTERGLAVDEKLVEELVNGNHAPIREGMLESQEKTLRAFERLYRWEMYARRVQKADLRETVNSTVREAAKGMRLSKSNPEHLKAMKIAAEGLTRTIEQDVKKANDDFMYTPERERKLKERSLKAPFATIRQFGMVTAKSLGSTDKYVEAASKRISNELAKIEKAKRAAEVADSPAPKRVAQTSRDARMSEQQQRHQAAEAERKREQRRKRKEAKRKKQEPKEKTPSGHSQKYRQLRELEASAPVVFKFLMKNRKKAGLSTATTEDLISKLLQNKLPQRASHEALKAGFENEFPAAATPALIYLLTQVGKLARRPTTLRSRVLSQCKSLKSRGKFVDPVTDFLFKKGIFEEHHSAHGQGLRISISRKYK